MNKKEFCKKLDITEGQFDGSEEICGSLDLSSLTSIPEGFNPTVGGSLYLSSLTSIPEGFNPTVGGYLYLRSLTSIPEGFNPTVGGSLDLRSLTSIPEGFNPTVGGYLYLRYITKHIGANVNIPNIPAPDLQWDNGKYICKDGILTEVVSNRHNVYKVRKIARKEIEYLITDGNGNWAHGDTLEEAKEDLMYKISDRRKSDYEHLTLDDTLPVDEAIKCYRVITGACSSGTRDFIKNRLRTHKSSYKISEMIELTEGEYGNKSFKYFFEK